MHAETPESIEWATWLYPGARPIELLLIDDDLEDVRRTRDALAESKINNTVHVATDAGSAHEFFGSLDDLGNAARPDVVLLSLRLWHGGGRTSLEKMVRACVSQGIPVVVVTDGEPDPRESDDGLIAAACSLSRPVDVPQLVRLVRRVEEFWFTIVRVGPTVG